MMIPITRASDIGMRGMHALANMPVEQCFDVIAEGMPLLLKSADELLVAAEQLNDHPRSASILVSQASEELAKMLILTDIVRCPAKLRSHRIPSMVRWFYNHLARIIYVEAQSWKPTNIRQLQSYVDNERRSHYHEGSVGEYIFPNLAVFMRESQIYADVIRHDDGQVVWNEPSNTIRMPFGSIRPMAWSVCSALVTLGATSRGGLDVMSRAWGTLDFKDNQGWSAHRDLTHTMFSQLLEAGLVLAEATDDQMRLLYHQWQMPMYCIDFSPISVPLADLRAEREANIWREAGD